VLAAGRVHVHVPVLVLVRPESSDQLLVQTVAVRLLRLSYLCCLEWVQTSQGLFLAHLDAVCRGLLPVWDDRLCAGMVVVHCVDRASVSLAPACSSSLQLDGHLD
jgi:hypothetical protein